MTFLPIVARELRVAARGRGIYRARSGAALVSILVMSVALVLLELQSSTAQGKSVFTILTVLAFGYCLLAGTRATSDCVSSEKREGTIGLLFLTDLRGYDVVIGKLVSCALTAFYGLLATVPVLALVLPLGGVTGSEVLRMALLFLNTLFVSMAAGMFASALSRNDRRALIATACVIFAIAGGPYALAVGWAIWLDSQGRPPASLWEFAAVLKPSPIFAFQIARTGYATRSLLADFFGSLVMAHLTGWLLLAAASWIVPRVCRERPAGRFGLWWLEIQNRWRYGRSTRRRAIRQRLLDRNAFYWLAARDRLKGYLVWFFVLAFAGMWCCIGWQMESFTFDWDMSFWLLCLLFLFFKLWFASEVCSHWVEHRESGAFELLLSSPLTLKEIARGQSLALWRQFGKPVLLMLVLSSLLMVSGLRGSHYDVTRAEVKLLFFSIMLMLVADLFTIKWVGMWQGITSNQIHRAITATCLRVLAVPTVIFLVLHGITTLVLLVFRANAQHSSAWTMRCWLWLTIGLATNLFFGLRARRNFLGQFRQLATERFSAHAETGLWSKLLQGVRQSIAKRPAGTADHLAYRPIWTRWWARGAAVILLTLIVLFGGWRYRLAREVQAQLASIRAAGLPVSSADLKTWLPFVPADENAGVTLQTAAPMLSLPNRWPRPARLPLFYSTSGLRTLAWAGPLGSTNAELRATIANVLEQNQQGIALLRKASAQTKSRMALDWNSRSPGTHPSIQIGRLRPAGALLQLDAWMALQDGEFQRAAETALALLGLARVMNEEPLLVARHERLLHLNAALGILEKILSEHSLPDHVLAQFSEQLEEAATATGPALARAYIVERCLEIEAFQSLGKSSAGAWRSATEQMLINAGNSLGVFLGFRDRILLRYLEVMSPLIERSRRIGEATTSAGSTNNTHSTNHPAAGAQQYWENILDQQSHLAAQLRIAATVVAVERFRLEHQRLPTDLNELQPKFLARIAKPAFGPFEFQELNPGYRVTATDPMSPSGRNTSKPGLAFTVTR